MDRDDGMDDEVLALLRTAITLAAQVAEYYARERERQAREAEAESERLRTEHQARVDAERVAARAQVQPVLNDDWWRRVTPERIGKAFETAEAWAGHDEVAQQAAERIRSEVKQRYGVDVDELIRAAHTEPTVPSEREVAATKDIADLTPEERHLSYLDAQRWLSEEDPELSERIGISLIEATNETDSIAAQNAAIQAHRRRLEILAAAELTATAEVIDQADEAHRQAAAEREENLRRATEARADQVMWQAAGARTERIVEELRSEAGEVITGMLGQVEGALAESEKAARLAHWYDVADRRNATEAKLTETVNDSEGVEARMLDDVSNALPPSAAVSKQHHPRARKTSTGQTTSRDLGQER